MSEKPLTTDDDLHRLPTDQELDRLQWTTVLYYLHETNPDNGLVRDKTDPDAPCSIAAVGLALATIPVVVERGVVIRKFAAKIARRRLRSLLDLPQGPEPDAAGYKGFFYHFLDIDTGRRVWDCELSTLDSAFLFAGVLTCATYFDADTAGRGRGPPPGRRTLPPGRLGLGARRRPDAHPRLEARDRLHPAPLRRATTRGCCSTCSAWARRPTRCRRRATPPTAPPTSGRRSTAASCSTPGRCSPTSSRTCGSTSAASGTPSCASAAATTSRTAGRRPTCSRSTRSATRSQFVGYGEHCWGFTACDGPGWVKRVVDGVERQFFDYIARGAPFGPDDGTVAPWVVVASLPFAPEIVIPTVRHFAGLNLGGMTAPYGFKPSFNQTFRVDDSPTGWWVTPYHFGIDQGPVVLMIENYRTGLIWDIMRRCPYVVAGLRRAGFTGGWL